MNKPLSIYIHIPFCRSKCLYCDFFSRPGAGSAAKKYTFALIRDINKSAKLCRDYSVKTIYIGGGTPSVIDPALIGEILAAVKNEFDTSSCKEITMEANPATVDSSSLAKYREYGINRLSIGLQSIHENELRALGRIHAFNDFENTFILAKNAGFDNISADLMFGIPEQTKESLRESIIALCSLAPEHISLYDLKIEEGTPFSKMSLSLPDEESEYEMYLSSVELLKSFGYTQYEVSNFAKEGKESLHNRVYWQRGEYLGFGASAHSFFGCRRFFYKRGIDSFIAGEKPEISPPLSPEDILTEYTMLSLRTSDGIDKSVYSSLGGEELNSRIEKYISDGYAEKTSGGYRLTPRGFFISNYIISDLI